MGSAHTIVDAQGSVLPGTDPCADAFGCEPVKGDLVHVLQANNGVLPPLADGTPHGSNALLYVTRIGRGVVPSVQTRGQFAASLAPRPSGTIVVRVFDGPSLAQATHYADSQTFAVNGNTIFLADVAAVSQPFAADSDGDGLNDPWEGYLGSAANKVDTDGDGVGDEAEYRAGTGLSDAGSYLGLSTVRAVSGSMWEVEWESVAGMSYQIQYADHVESGVYGPVGSIVIATGALCRVQVAAGGFGPNGAFRVRLVD